MGNLVSIEPDKDGLKAIKKGSFVGQDDLKQLKDRLKVIAQEEGGIDRENFEKTFTDAGLDKEYASALYTTLDDGDEWMEFAQFCTYAALLGRATRAKKIEYCFRAFDGNGNKCLDRTEMNELFEAVFRTIRRCNQTPPGTMPKNPEKVTLSASEKKKIKKASERFYEKVDNDKSGDDITFIEFIRYADKHEVKQVLDYFDSWTSALPVAAKGSYPDAEGKTGTPAKGSKGKGKGKGKGKSKGKGKGKDKNKGKGKGKGKSDSDASASAASDASASASGSKSKSKSKSKKSSKSSKSSKGSKGSKSSKGSKGSK